MGTWLQHFHDNVARGADRPCWRYKSNGRWHVISWREMGDRVRGVAGWLIAHGLQPGDRVALWSSTRWEWSLIDLAVVMAGGVTVPIYHTLPLAQGELIVREPACRFLFLELPIEHDFLPQLHRCALPLEGVIFIDAEATCPQYPTSSLRTILTQPQQCIAAYEARWRARQPDDVVTIVYTSGTTGTPKGVELTTRNLQAEIEGLNEAFHLTPGTECLMFLPLAHIVARAMQFFQIEYGLVAAYAESIDTIGDNLREVAPHFFVGVPRVFEKMEARLREAVAQSPPCKQRLFAWALAMGECVSRCREHHQRLSLRLRLGALLVRLIFRSVHRRLGGRLTFAISGGAPLPQRVAQFFASLGVLIIEGYGLTETTAAVTINQRSDYRFGTVGKPLRGVTVSIATDGEILVRGATVFRGYYRRSEETAAVLDHDGWLHTGDIGQWSRDGFLRITDRKKDLIKTSGGKYIAPQPIEHQLKASPYISDVIVHGDREKFLTALIILDRDAITRYLDRKGMTWATWEEVVRHPAVVAVVQEAIDRVNRGLARWETIKRFSILERELAVERGELTPTLKIRRQIAYERYKDHFDRMYREA
ncbi:MAG: long-chain fatty acid--CoA ligase [Deltaproteobacteria bacterium]|nr:long-chain fatty acid--CoA ligase [Deltaproteobacteria bacterium]